MKTLKRSLILTILLAVISSGARANCQSDCRAALAAGDRLIQDLKEEVSVQKQLQAEQQKQIVNLTVQNEEKTEQLSSVFRNPFVMGTIGFLVGAGTVLYFKR